MKKILTLLSIVFAFSLNAQVIPNQTSVTGITLPNLKSGVIHFDSTGKNLKSWILYKVENHTAGKMMSYNELVMDSLPVGNYWLLATSNDPNYPFNYSYESIFTVGVNPTNPCQTTTSLGISYLVDSYPGGPSMDFFCGSSNGNTNITNMQWYHDSIPMSTVGSQLCQFATQVMPEEVITLVGYNGTCNESILATLGLSNLSYPSVSVFAGSGSFTSGSSAALEEKSINKVKVYPNPFNEFIKIESDNINNIKIWNIVGELIYQTKGENVTINSINISNGNYIIEVDNQRLLISK